jgi:hypothetical protein
VSCAITAVRREIAETPGEAAKRPSIAPLGTWNARIYGSVVTNP